METPVKLKNLAYVFLSVRDGDKALAFYRDILGVVFVPPCYAASEEIPHTISNVQQCHSLRVLRSVSSAFFRLFIFARCQHGGQSRVDDQSRDRRGRKG